jgi:hypothetical protein
VAKKSKGFKQLLYQEQKQQSKNAVETKLAERFQQRWGSNHLVVPSRESQAKLSEALETLVTPYLEATTSSDDSYGLFTMAVFAWNLALASEAKRAVELEKAVAIFAEQNSDPEYIEDTLAILNELIERKQDLFPQLQRHILDFDLKEDRRGGFFLSVVSTPD